MKIYTKQFFYLLDEKAKKSIFFLILAFLLTSLLDVFSIGLVGVFLGLLNNPHFFLQKIPQIAFFLQDLNEKKIIFIAGILIVSAFAIKTIIILLIQSKLVFFCQSLSLRLKTRMMTAYQYAPYTYHLRKNSSHLVYRIQTNLGTYINSVLLPMLNLSSNLLVAGSILFFLLMLHPFLTGFLIVMFACVGFGYDFFVKQKLLAMGKMVSELGGEIIKNINQGLHGLTEIRVLGREDYFLNSLDKVSRQFSHAAGIVTALQQIPRYLIENIIAIFVVGISLGCVAFGFKESHVIAIVGMFAAAGARLLPTVNQIITTVSQIRGSYANMSLIYDDLSELDQLTKDLSEKGKLLSRYEGKLNFSAIDLHGIVYAYPHANGQALQNVNIKIIKGQSIGLIGPSGAGKSTLVNVILGLLEPQDGQLLVDGCPVQNYRAWLNNFAYIPQSIFLLDDTLQRNIALGIEDKDIDEVRVWNAIKMAQLSDVVHQLSNGLNTLIGENGVRLSGGQRQRVALARAFYHERDIIIMDEATSSLDHETESEVINTIKRLKGNKTLIVIAHRLTTVEHCDVLYRLDKGSITAVGSFQEVVGVAR